MYGFNKKHYVELFFAEVYYILYITLDVSVLHSSVIRVHGMTTRDPEIDPQQSHFFFFFLLFLFLLFIITIPMTFRCTLFVSRITRTYYFINTNNFPKG